MCVRAPGNENFDDDVWARKKERELEKSKPDEENEAKILNVTALPYLELNRTFISTLSNWINYAAVLFNW